MHLNRRQESFCRHFVELGNATMAARAAGYAPRSARNAGYRLLREPKIAARVNAIQAELGEWHGRETAALLGKLETVYRRAIDLQQFSVAARAVELQAKLGEPGTKPWRSSKPQKNAPAIPAAALTDEDG